MLLDVPVARICVERYGDVVVSAWGTEGPGLLHDQHALAGIGADDRDVTFSAIVSGPRVVEDETAGMGQIEVDVSGENDFDRTSADIPATVGGNAQRPEGTVRISRLGAEQSTCKREQPQSRARHTTGIITAPTGLCRLVGTVERAPSAARIRARQKARGYDERKRRRFSERRPGEGAIFGGFPGEH